MLELIAKKIAQYIRTNEVSQLDAAINMADAFLRTCEPNTHNYTEALEFKGIAHLSRYRQTQKNADLDHAFDAFQIILSADIHGSSRSSANLFLAECQLEKYKYCHQTSLLEEAINIFDSTAADLNQVSAVKSEAVYYHSLALWEKYLHSGELTALEAAIKSADASWSLYRSIEFVNPASLIDHLGKLFYHSFLRTENIDDVSRAISCHAKAIELVSSFSRHPFKHIYLRNLGLALKDRGVVTSNNLDLQNGLKCLEESLRLCPKGSSYEPGALSNLAICLCHIFEVTKDFKLLQRASKLFERAISLSTEDTHDKLFFLERFAALKRRHFAIGKGDNYFEESIALLEQALLVIQSILYKSSVAYKLHRQTIGTGVYENLVTMYLKSAQMGHLNADYFGTRAFEVSEMAKSTILTQLLNSAARLQPSTIPADLLDKELSLSEKLFELDLLGLKGVSAPLDENERLKHARTRDSVFAERDRCLSQIAAIDENAIKYIEMRKGCKVSWHQLQETMNSLGPEVALLSLFSVNKMLILFVNRAGFTKPKFYVIGGEAFEKLSDCLNNFNDEFIDFEPEFERTDRWREAGKIIFPPIMPYLAGVEHLIISPHKEFHGLAFQALYVDESKILLDLFTTSYVSGVGSFIVENAKRHVEAENILVLGVKPFADEAKKIAKIYGVNAIVDDAAVSSCLREISNKSFELIHISSHAHFKRQQPLDSGIEFPDGMFTVRDWLELRCPINLVVLSGCSSGASDTLGADEQAGFAQALALSGVRTAILSQSSVNPYASAYMFEHFHHLYKQRTNASIAELLRQSAIALRDGKLTKAAGDTVDYSAAYYWASFCVYGMWLASNHDIAACPNRF
jgi:tetratricopeptide (TPR) repeat protein